MLQNFSYILDGVLAGSALPGRYGELRADLSEARAMGITAIVSLNERGLHRATIAEEGFRYLHLPVEDYKPPTLAQVEEFVAFVDAERARGGAVMAHCVAGIGRTGTMLAAYLVKEGRTAPEAIREVRTRRRGSIETTEQEDLIAMYEAKLQRKR
jgi:atypical dual specificity phosphatase